MRYFIGLMTGTSLDAIDAALILQENQSFEFVDALNHPLADHLVEQLSALLTTGDNEIERIAEAENQLSHAYSQAVFALSQKSGVAPSQIIAIGNHGQTIRHRPPNDSNFPFSLQIGDPHLLASLTHIPVVSDFRRKDIALGGQGAPLAPSFHDKVFRNDSELRFIVNLGGIANVSILAPTQACLGFDTGPGNTLLDQWTKTYWGEPYDQNGTKAASGQNNPSLLNILLEDAFFTTPPPKSTGREYFNLDWLKQKLSTFQGIDPIDVLTTLCHLTAETLIKALTETSLEDTYSKKKIYLCGGGTHNDYLVRLITNKAQNNNIDVGTTNELSIHPDWVEAAAFGWLAARNIDKLTGNLPSVTGASREAILGSLTMP